MVNENDLLEAIQGGIPLENRPFLKLAQRLAADETEILEVIRRWAHDGTLRRFGVVVRHHELGYAANAMLVWDVPDDRMDEAAAALVATGQVSLCYQRNRQLPEWPYNLFCMLHGRDRGEVTARIDCLRRLPELSDCPSDVLFSTRRFKQSGARYREEANHGRS